MTFFISGEDITFSVPRPSMTFGLGHFFIRQGRRTGSRGRPLGTFFLAAGKLGPPARGIRTPAFAGSEHLRLRGRHGGHDGLLEERTTSHAAQASSSPAREVLQGEVPRAAWAYRLPSFEPWWPSTERRTVREAAREHPSGWIRPSGRVEVEEEGRGGGLRSPWVCPSRARSAPTWVASQAAARMVRPPARLGAPRPCPTSVRGGRRDVGCRSDG